MMRRLLAGASVAVVLLSGCEGSDDEPDAEPRPTQSTSADQPTDPGPVVRCPRDVAEPDPELPDEVPEGATSVRLCDGGADRVTPPVDALTTDVASVVDAVNDQPVVERPCADHQLPTYQLAFGYPDGTRFVVAGRFTGCAELLVGSARRGKAQPPLRTFVDLLLAQRSGVEPPAPVDPADLDCAQQSREWTLPLGDPADMTAAVVCVGRPEDPGQARRVVVPERALETLVASVRSDTGPPRATFGCGGFNLSEPWIVTVTAWGDPFVMTKDCLDYRITDELTWQPRGAANGVLGRLIRRAR